MSFVAFYYLHCAFLYAKFHPWLYILTGCIRVSNSFLFFAFNVMSFMYIRWLIFSCDLQSLYPAVHFLSMWLSGIITIINSNGDSVSPWNVFFWFPFQLSFSLLLSIPLSRFSWLLTLADGLSQKSEWLQVSLGLQDSSQYSGRSHQCCYLDGFDSFFDFQLFQPLFQAFRDSFEHTKP